MKTDLPEEMRVRIVQNNCALRFDGYAYGEHLERRARQEGRALREGDGVSLMSDIASELERTLTMRGDEDENFAAFFVLQRYLGKWGGEMLKKDAPERILFDFLFLHLYRLETPSGFVCEEYVRQWRECQENVEEVAAILRRSLVYRCR